MNKTEKDAVSVNTKSKSSLLFLGTSQNKRILKSKEELQSYSTQHSCNHIINILYICMYICKYLYVYNVKIICEPQPGGSQHISFYHHFGYHFFISILHLRGLLESLWARDLLKSFLRKGPFSLRQMVPCYENRLCQS